MTIEKLCMVMAVVAFAMVAAPRAGAATPLAGEMKTIDGVRVIAATGVSRALTDAAPVIDPVQFKKLELAELSGRYKGGRFKDGDIYIEGEFSKKQIAKAKLVRFKHLQMEKPLVKPKQVKLKFMQQGCHQEEQRIWETDNYHQRRTR